MKKLLEGELELQAEDIPQFCGDCGKQLQVVRPGKWQCECEVEKKEYTIPSDNARYDLSDYPKEKEVCLDCGGWGMIHENVDCPAIGTFNECACNVLCPSCKPDKSTYYHSDPTTKGVEERTQEED